MQQFTSYGLQTPDHVWAYNQSLKNHILEKKNQLGIKIKNPGVKLSGFK